MTAAAAPSLPRNLKMGEFYCHNCQEFIAMQDRAEHQKEHDRLARVAHLRDRSRP
jgi:hypothetical protein